MTVDQKNNSIHAQKEHEQTDFRPQNFSFTPLFEAYVQDESHLVAKLHQETGLTQADQQAVFERSQALILSCRENAKQANLFESFLNEYSLSTEEGLILMRLAEAFIRTPDSKTAHLLLRDKLSKGNWRSHTGSSPSPFVNTGTRALMIAQAWINATGGTAAPGLLARLGDPALDKAVKAAMSLLSRHFVLGKTITQALKRSKAFKKKGFIFSYDMLGEAAHTHADASKYFTAYETAMKTLALKTDRFSSVHEAPSLSVKLSALHPRYETAQQHSCIPDLLTSLKHLCLLAKDANLGLTIDAEEADRLEISLIIASELLQDPDLEAWDGLSIVVQAYQRRSFETIRLLLAQARQANRKFAIRLVKGAYWDMEIKRAQEMGLKSYPVFTRKENTDLSYLACARLLLQSQDIVFSQFATHNAATAAAILYMAEQEEKKSQNSVPSQSPPSQTSTSQSPPFKTYEFQRLHGMAADLHQHLIKTADVRSRIYAPVGQYRDLLPYLVRRLLENGANSSFVNQLLNPSIPVEKIAQDPIAAVLQNTSAENPLIPSPTDLFSGSRQSAQGVDFTQNISAEHLQNLLKEAPSLPFEATSLIEGKPYSGEKDSRPNPAQLEQTVTQAYQASEEALSGALKSAEQSSWGSSFTAAQRANCLRQAADLLEKEQDHFLALCVQEAGKTWPDAIAELREAIDFCRYYADQAQSDHMQNRSPLGTVACISPWNFPLAIFLGQVTAALSAGNTVVCKPAEQTPLLAFEAVRLLHHAGIPKDALHLVLGTGAVIGAKLVSAPQIKGICFTGSTATAKNIAKSLAQSNRPLTPFIAETGGLNAMIVDSTALLEQSVEAVVASAFQSAGQRCSACRLVCVQEEIADSFIEMLDGSMKTLVIGNPALLKTDVGPVIDAQALHVLEEYATQAKKQWKLVGESFPKASQQKGYFFTPLAFEIPDISALSEEKFGPILHVMRFKAQDFTAVINQINALGYGLTMGGQTRIDSRVETLTNTARVGNLYINRNQIGAVVGVQPFGGEGLSGTGPKAGGPHYLRRLSKSSTPSPSLKETSTPFSVDIPARSTLESASLTPLLKKAKDSALSWGRMDHKTQIISQAFGHVFAENKTDFEDSLSNANSLLSSPSNLPGPTGETNRLSLVERGTLLCFASSEQSIFIQQLARCLATGNSLLICAESSQQEKTMLLAQTLQEQGAPKNLITLVSEQEASSLLDLGIDGVVVEGTDQQTAIATRLCQREGALLPVLSVEDDLERFCVEHTTTIDTTAAGGNATLLSL